MFNVTKVFYLITIYIFELSVYQTILGDKMDWSNDAENSAASQE